MASRRKTLTRTVLAAWALTLLVGSRTHAQEHWPTKAWRTSTPEAQGMDAAALSALDAEFAAGKHGYVNGMLVVRNGYVVFERSYSHDYDKLFQDNDSQRGPYNYYDPDWHPYYRRGELHTTQSVSKSVTSALVGIALRRGEIPSVDVKMVPFFGEFKLTDADPRRAALTLRHVLTMTAGIKWDETSVPYTNPANRCAAMEQSEDWIQFVLDQPMAERPGEVFLYNSGATQLLSYLIKKTTGREADDYAVEHLFKPLGIGKYYWKRTPKGLADTEGGLYLTARDLAKIGYLYLKDGVWDGRRLLPEGWVTVSTAPIVDTRVGGPRSRRYGYQWWLLPHGETGESYAFAALGHGGQRLLVVPGQNLVAVFTGWNIYNVPALDPQRALDRVLKSVKTPSVPTRK